MRRRRLTNAVTEHTLLSPNLVPVDVSPPCLECPFLLNLRNTTKHNLLLRPDRTLFQGQGLLTTLLDYLL